MALARSPREALLWTLNDLDERDFKKLKFHLRDQNLMPWGELEGLSQVDLASRLILICGAQEAVKVVLKKLKHMNLLELVDQLSDICLNDYRELYREHVRCLEERLEGGVKSSYNQLLLVAKSSPESLESPSCPVLDQDLPFVTVEALFDPGEKSWKDPPLVVLQGNAGTGKTTLVRKIMQDWANGKLYPGRFDYVFYVSCREVDLLPEARLDQLLCWCCGDSQAPVTEIQRQPERLLFILDGFDELQRPFAEGMQRPRQSPAEFLLHRLMRRDLLSTSSILITTRPSALQNLKSLLKKPRHVHVLGFSQDERKRYFSSYFTDEEQAKNAFDIVQGNDVLYKACQVPAICWVVCSWLKTQMERGKEVSEKPSNDTDIFMAYVTTFLPPTDNGDCSELARDRVLKGLCSLAAEGIQHQKFLFKEADLKKHNLDGSRLAPFLSSNDYQQGFDIKKLYSFRHIIFQEFFYAISYLMKEKQNQREEESCRGMDMLLYDKKQSGNEEMTLSMQILWDLLKKESSSYLELKLCFKIPPSIKQDLKHFKEQMESIKRNRTWELEFSLYDFKLKNLAKNIQMSDITLKIGHSNVKKSHNRSSFLVKTSLSDEQKWEEKCPLAGKGNIAETQMEVSNRKSQGDRGTRDKKVRSRIGSREMGITELKGQKDGEVEGQEDGDLTESEM